jgi:hypothetical protein
MKTPGSANPIPHLWFVITEPDPATNLCAVVSLTTLRGDKDQTVVLGPSDHTYISRSSVIHYIGALIVNEARLSALLAAGTIQMHDCCPSETLKLVQQGISGSPHTPRKVIEFCKQAWHQSHLSGGG